MKKKLLTLILLCCMLTLVGCGKTESKNSKNTASGTKKSESKEELNIDDIEISFEPGSTSDYSSKQQDIMKINYTNNTKNIIYGITLEFALKEGITFEQLSEAFPDKKAESMEEFEYAEFVGKNYGKTEPKESNDEAGIVFMSDPMFGVHDQETLDFLDKDSLKVMYVGSDDKMHFSEYSYSNGTWSDYKDPTDLYEESNSELSKMLPEIELDCVQIESDDDELEYNCYDAAEDYLETYTQKLKDAGFTDDISEYDRNFTGKNKDGYKVRLFYKKSECRLDIRIEKD